MNWISELNWWLFCEYITAAVQIGRTNYTNSNLTTLKIWARKINQENSKHEIYRETEEDRSQEK